MTLAMELPPISQGTFLWGALSHINLIPQEHNCVHKGVGGQYGIENLKYKNDIVVPIPKNDELFIRVKGPGINNTDINTIIER